MNNDHGDIVQHLSSHNAKWHKSCRDQLNNTKFLGLMKKVDTAGPDSDTEANECEPSRDISNCSTRSSQSSFSASYKPGMSTCFFVISQA